jgi:hypothetical protein
MSYAKGLLQRFGTKKGAGFQVVWKEVLDAK